MAVAQRLSEENAATEEKCNSLGAVININPLPGVAHQSAHYECISLRANVAMRAARSGQLSRD